MVNLIPRPLEKRVVWAMLEQLTLFAQLPIIVTKDLHETFSEQFQKISDGSLVAVSWSVSL